MGYIFNPDIQTPEDVKRQRDLADLMMQQQAPAKEPFGVLGMALSGLGGILADRRANAAQKSGRDKANALWQSILGGQGRSSMGTSVGTPSQYVKTKTELVDTPASANPTLNGLQRSFTQKPQTTTTITGAPGLIADELKKAGYQPHQIAGLLGNLQQESGFNPGAYNPNDPGGSFGFGQWNRDRKANLANFANQLGGNPADPAIQAKFIAHELATSEKGAGDALRNAPDLQSATAAAIGYERPQGWTSQNPMGGHGWNNRLQYAQGFMGGNGIMDRFNSLKQAGIGRSSVQPAGAETQANPLLQAIGDPSFQYLTPQQQQLAIGMYQQQQQQSDPYRQLQMQKLQTDIADSQNPRMTPYQAEQLKLEREKMAKNQVGQREWGLQPVITQDPQTGQYHLFQLSKDGSAPQEIKLPYNWTPQQQYLDTGTAFQAMPKVGVGAGPVVPKDVSGEAAATALGTQQGAAQARLPVANISAQQTIGKIDELLGNPGLKNVSGLESYYPDAVAGALDWISGTPDGQTTVDLRSRVDQLMGGAFLEARDELKGAGQVTDFEGKQAADAYARMKAAQTDGAFRQALQDFRQAIIVGYQKLEAKAGKQTNAFPGAAPTPVLQQQPAAPAPQPQSGPINPGAGKKYGTIKMPDGLPMDIQSVWDYMTDDERKAFLK